MEGGEQKGEDMTGEQRERGGMTCQQAGGGMRVCTRTEHVHHLRVHVDMGPSELANNLIINTI